MNIITTSLNDEFMCVADPTPHPSPLMGLGEIIAALLETLPIRIQRVLALRYFRDCTVKQVATATRMSRDHVRSAEQAGLRMLRHPSRIRRLEGFLEASELHLS